MRINDRQGPLGHSDRSPMYGSVWLTLFLLLREGRSADRRAALSDEETPSPRP